MQYAVGSGSRQLTGQRHVLVLLKNLLVSSWKNLPRRVSKQMLPWPVEMSSQPECCWRLWAPPHELWYIAIGGFQ